MKIKLTTYLVIFSVAFAITYQRASAQVLPERVLSPKDFYNLLDNYPGIKRDVPFLRFRKINPTTPSEQVDYEISLGYDTKNILTSMTFSTPNDPNPNKPSTSTFNFLPHRIKDVSNTQNDYIYYAEEYNWYLKIWIPVKITGRFDSRGLDTAWITQYFTDGQYKYSDIIRKTYTPTGQLSKVRTTHFIGTQQETLTEEYERRVLSDASNKRFFDLEYNLDPSDTSLRISYTYKNNVLDSTFIKGVLGYHEAINGGLTDLAANKFYYDSLGNLDTIRYYSIEHGFGYKLYFKRPQAPSGIENLEITRTISVYPNPAKNYLFLNAENFNTNEPFSIEVYDYSGKNCLIQQVNFRESNIIDIQTLPYGLYFIKISNNNSEPVYHKFIKE